MMRLYPALVWFTLYCSCSLAEIPRPQDAPKPRSPEESAKSTTVPKGLKLQLVASEPLIKEPSGVCWDEAGRLFVCELHGYNLEGQYDIEELNKTGKLDRVVRRIQANEGAKRKAEEEAHGVVKRLIDQDGDGRMDAAEVWADDLPPCLGICPARGGIIAICSPEIIFLADRDQDGKAEIRETLFEGFQTGVIERRINAPKWGLDNWIYIGRGQGGRITGPHLRTPVNLPATDFRIKPDGSAIEPVTGGTHTFGFTFDASGNRFVISTRSPAIQIAPIPWRYLARNPDLAAPSLEANVTPYQQTYPRSQAHPWRTRRAEDPGFSKYYTDRYGTAESAPNGFFTSACSPLIYQDSVLPGLAGHLLACEPAQNLIHRGVLQGDGLNLVLQRHPGEEQSEFLAATDIWFHPIALSHAPDGGVAIVDFYREIIEDYSAIPRYLQQQYGLVNGRDHGRIWKLTPANSQAAPPSSMSSLSTEQLVKEAAGPFYWRRQTARRLLVEHQDRTAAKDLKKHLEEDANSAGVINSLYTLDGLKTLEPGDILQALKSRHPAVRVHALRFSESWLDRNEAILEDVLKLSGDPHETVLLQLALTLGESENPRVVPVLAELVETHGSIRWMPTAVLSSAPDRGVALLEALLRSSNSSPETSQGMRILNSLCQMIGTRRNAKELSEAIVLLRGTKNTILLQRCLDGFSRAFSDPIRTGLSEEATMSLRSLSRHENQRVRQSARKLTVLMKAETAAEKVRRLELAKKTLSDLRQPALNRLQAIEELAAETDGATTGDLISAFSEGTPRVRSAILAALLSRKDRHPALVSALETGRIEVSVLSAIQREALENMEDKKLAARARKLFSKAGTNAPPTFQVYTAALEGERNRENGERVFKAKCAACHEAHGLGHAVGPDLNSEFRRAEETILKDLLAPSAQISPEYTSYLVQTVAGRTFSGLLAMESPASLTLKEAEGKSQTILRRDIEAMRVSRVSLMPDNLVKELSPKDVADVIAWVRQPPASQTLFDENSEFARQLVEGGGTATIETGDAHHGLLSLKITPLQKFSARIPGWSFRVRKNPAPGEFRYLSWAWKSADGKGALIEIAADGRWPAAGSPRFRYYSGENTTDWQATRISAAIPRDWTVVTRDLWEDFGDCTITGIAPTALNGAAWFDQIRLTRDKPTQSNE